MKFPGIELFHLQIPFRRAYKHALADHRASNTVLAKVTTDTGVIGWGETVPRRYLTGETPQGVIDCINNKLWPSVRETEIAAFDDIRSILEPLCDLSQKERTTAAYCALELALLDAAGKDYNTNAGGILGPMKRRGVRYTAPVDDVPPKDAMRRAFIFRLLGFRDFKVKVGQEGDIELVRAVRKVVGNKANIRVDANCAWDAQTAVRKAQRLAGLGVSSMEQPTPADDIEAMAEVAKHSPIPIMADESLCTVEDAEQLARKKACGIFNVRLAKCGGLPGAKKIIDFAARRGIAWQLGCLVGETSILAAAERALLSRMQGSIHVEYPFTRQLLLDHICKSPGPRLPRGRARIAESGPGLGISLNEGKARKLAGTPEE